MRDHNAGRRVLWLDYEAYEPLAVKAFERIGEEAADRWPAARLAIHHRIGRLEIGEASVVIAAASPHRAEAFAACRYAIERIKQIAPIWKHEHFDGGDVWIEGATADPRTRTRARTRRWSARARNRPSVRAAARNRRRRRAARDGAGRSDGARRVGRRWSASSRPRRLRAGVSCAVNEDYARLTTTLRDGDEVAFLPPVSGG